MKTAFLIGLAAMLVDAACPIGKLLAQSASSEPSLIFRKVAASNDHPALGSRPMFGYRAAGLIRVEMDAEFRLPGIYYFPTGTLMLDAVQCAGGIKPSLARSTSHQADFKIPLRNGDSVILTCSLISKHRLLWNMIHQP